MKKVKTAKRAARSDGEGTPPPTRVKKSKKKKVASAERTPGSDRGSKSKDAEPSDAADNSPLTGDSQRNELTQSSSPKRLVGPRTPPGPEPHLVSSTQFC